MNNPNNDPLKVGDRVKLFHQSFTYNDSSFEVTRIVSHNDYYATRIYNSGGVATNNSFAQSRGFTWLKITSKKDIAELILPGKPLLVVGHSSRDKRYNLIKEAIETLPNSIPINCFNSLGLSTQELASLACSPVSCKKAVLNIAGIHAFHRRPNGQALERVLLYLMRNKKRRMVLTGESCDNPNLLGKIANTIYYLE